MLFDKNKRLVRLPDPGPIGHDLEAAGPLGCPIPHPAAHRIAPDAQLAAVSAEIVGASVNLNRLVIGIQLCLSNRSQVGVVTGARKIKEASNPVIRQTTRANREVRRQSASIVVGVYQPGK